MNLQRGLLPRLSCLSSSPISIITRTFVNRHVYQPTPPVHDPALFQHGVGRFSRPVQPIRTTEEFLKAIGRSSETKVDKDMPWEEFWKMDGHAMRKAGVAVGDRRYILRCMEKFRLGFPIEDIAYEASPKKTIRGWGPKVQNGKRIRSKRIKDKTKRRSVVTAKSD
ncbi:hypothetical protein CPC08DRAFT_679238 [Agrocybe pediades]|nr:hypothetical protein CPC08DRAFT_679238 [Agrocybe pediades]